MKASLSFFAECLFRCFVLSGLHQAMPVPTSSVQITLFFKLRFFFFQVCQILFFPLRPQRLNSFLTDLFQLCTKNHTPWRGGSCRRSPHKRCISMELYPLSVSSPQLLCKFLLSSQKQPAKFHNKQTKRETFLKHPALLHINYFFSPDMFCRISAVLIWARRGLGGY